MAQQKKLVRLGCRVSRKVSDGNYGSHEVSHEISYEVEVNSAAELDEKARQQRRIVDKMIVAGLAERCGKNPAPKATEVSAVAQLLEDW